MKNSKLEIDLGALENSCFVVMPFSQMFQTEYDKIIQPVLLELNIKCVRGDEIYTKQRIMDDLWDSIRKCRFVLAELTDRNPNVMYEIGLAHAIGKPVIIITRNSEDVPFDLKGLRYLFYDVNDPFWGDNLKKGIKNLVEKVLENPEIESYLQGISRVDSAPFPKITKPKEKVVKTELPDISGTWIGSFIDHENDRCHLTLQIDQADSEIYATAIITIPVESGNSVVQQIMNGSFNKNIVMIHGVNYTFLERNGLSGYSLDSYELEFKAKQEQMVGFVISQGEKHEIKLKKTTTSNKT